MPDEMDLSFVRETYMRGGYVLLCKDPEGDPVLLWCGPNDIYNRPQRQGDYRFVLSKAKPPAPCDAVMSHYRMP